MKKLLQISLAVVALGATLSFQSCDKIKSAVTPPDISFTGASTDVTIPPTNDTTSQAAIGVAPLAFNIDSMIKAQTGGVYSFSSIKSVKIATITLTLLDGGTANNFANFTYAGAEFNSDANNGSYDPYTIAYVENNPDSYNITLSPKVQDATQDVKKYFHANMTFYYLIVAKLRRPITSTLHCHVDITYTLGF